MAEDSFHHLIENEMRRRKNVYDFNEFHDIINAKGNGVVMEVGDSPNYENKLSKAKGTNYPYMDDIVAEEFRSGSTCLFWKEDMGVNTEFKHGEFLQKKFIKIIYREFTAKILPPAKKNSIISKLCRLLSVNRQGLWKDLQTNDSVDDLLDTHHLQENLSYKQPKNAPVHTILFVLENFVYG